MESSILIALNGVACGIGIFICVCRMGLMKGEETKASVRWQYVVLFTSFVASAISWLWIEPPRPMQIVMGGAMVAYLLMGVDAWKHGEAPHYTRRVS